MKIDLIVDEGWQSENSPEGLPQEFQLLLWTKSVGDRIEKWDTIFWYDPQKNAMEYSSPVAGTLVEIRIPAFYSSEEDLLTDIAEAAKMAGGTKLKERLQKCVSWPRGSIAGVIEVIETED